MIEQVFRSRAASCGSSTCSSASAFRSAISVSGLVSLSLHFGRCLRRDRREVRRHGGHHPRRELVGLQPVERADQPIGGRRRGRRRSVPRRARGGELEPQRGLLRDFDRERPARAVDAPRSAFIDDKTRAPECLGVMLHHPLRPEHAAGLLVRRRHEDQITVERHVRAMQRQKRFQLEDAQRLRVERPAAPDLAILERRRERVGIPVLRIRGHDVHVVEQHQRGLGAALEPRPDVAATGSRGCRIEGDAFLLEDPREIPHRQDFIARRIGRVDPDVVRRALDCLVLELGGVDRGAQVPGRGRGWRWQPAWRRTARTGTCDRWSSSRIRAG